MYGRILVPLDGSERAELILEHVEPIARRFKSEIHLLQVIEPVPATLGLADPLPPIEQSVLDREYKDARSYLLSIQNRLRKNGVTSHVHLHAGGVVESIVDVAAREDVDLVAMASHGRSGLPRFYYGSVAAGVLHRVDRPLLIIRSQSVLHQAAASDPEADAS